MKEQWIKELQQQMQSYKPEPPAGLLDSVKRRINEAGASSVSGTGANAGTSSDSGSASSLHVRLRRLVIIRSVAAAMLVALAGAAVYLLQTPTPKDASTGVVAGAVSSDVSGKGKDVAAKDASGEGIASGESVAEIIVESSGKPEDSFVEKYSEKEMAAFSEEIKPEDSREPRNSRDPRDSRIPSDSRDPSDSRAPRESRLPIAPMTPSDSRKSGGTSPSRPSRKMNMTLYLSGGGDYNNNMRLAPRWTSLLPPGEEIIENGYLRSNTNITHEQPVKFGLSVGYPLSARWTLHSGLTYSRLVTKTFRTNLFHTNSTRQQLEYVGLPIALSYTLVATRRAKVYVSGGTEMQKLISGRTTSVSSDGDDKDTHETLKLRESQLQFSANLSAGISYMILRPLALYAEPGVSYYFNNNSNLQNFYKDRPLNFNFNLGVRIDF